MALGEQDEAVEMTLRRADAHLVEEVHWNLLAFEQWIVKGQEGRPPVGAPAHQAQKLVVGRRL
jgi:hypothetical protein